MSSFSFRLPNGSEARTCPAALGYSFAAGTSDGPGAFDFTQHSGNENTTSPVWKVVSWLLKNATPEQRACHSPKPILLDVGEIHTPYDWTPNIVDVQAFRVGQLIIIVSPGEASTMAGRRWKRAVRDASALLFPGEFRLPGRRVPEPIVVLGGPANSYTHYITTEEEYAIQRYEGASTLYGPHTLAAYIYVTLGFLPYLGANAPPPPSHDEMGLFPPDNSNRSLSFIGPVVLDGTPPFKSFGDVITDAERVYRRGERVRVVFVGANPRNKLRLEGTFAAVERLAILNNNNRNEEEQQAWTRVRDDGDWSLVYHWRRTSEILGTSEVEIVWETEDWAAPGVYRIRYYGDAKSLLGGHIQAFEGVSSAFTLL